MGNFKCEKGNYLLEDEFDKRNRFWNKKQFRTWTKKELEKDSNKIQNLLFAMSKFSLPEIQEIRKSKSSRHFKKDIYKMEIYLAHNGDFNYAMSIAPKTFFKSECPNR